MFNFLVGNVMFNTNTAAMHNVVLTRKNPTWVARLFGYKTSTVVASNDDQFLFNEEPGVCETTLEVGKRMNVDGNGIYYTFTLQVNGDVEAQTTIPEFGAHVTAIYSFDKSMLAA